MDLIGQKYGRLTVVENKTIGYKYKWKCICDCGNETIVYHGHLRSGHTNSCGCLNREAVINRQYKHGQSGYNTSKEYMTWLAMKSRCYNSNNISYKYYGERGIKICERWLNNFENFLTDMGKAPTKDHSIDRINNDGNYEPSNVRWTLPIEQANNRRIRR